MPKYPLAMTTDGKKAKSKLKKMKPEEFLESARKLVVGEGDRDIINKFKSDIEAGEPMGPLKLYADGTEDGRHRATAAKELDLDAVPVIDERTAKALGGALSSDDPNRFFSDVLKYSFAVLPLLRPGYLKEVPKQGFASGGDVDDALQVARQQGGGLWDLLKRSAGEVAEMVEPGSTTRKTPSVREVAEGLLPRDPYEVVGEAQKKFKKGDRIGAAEEMLGGIPETGVLRFKGPARPLETPRSIEEALQYIKSLPDVPTDKKWFDYAGFGPELSMKDLGFSSAPVLSGSKRLQPSAYVNVPLEQLRVVQPSATKDLVNKYISNSPSEVPAFSYFESGPWEGFSQISGTHRLAAAKALGLEKLPVGVYAKAQKGNRDTIDLPSKVSREMLQDIFGKDYLGFANGGHVLEDDYPTHYLPEVGRQVMADGGIPGQRFAAIDPAMLVGTSQQPFRGGQAYTDAGGQKIAAPFVSGLAGGYPVFDLGEKPKPQVQPLPGGKNPLEDWLQFNFLSKLMGRANGGGVGNMEDLLREIENEEMLRKTLQSIQGTSEPAAESPTTRAGSSPTTPSETDLEALLGSVMGTTPAGELRTPGIIESVPFDTPKQKMDPGEYISRGSTAARAHPFVFEKTPYHFGEDFAHGGKIDSALSLVRKLAGTPA